MRRIIFIAMSTLTVLVLLLSYRTSLDSSAATATGGSAQVVNQGAGSRSASGATGSSGSGASPDPGGDSSSTAASGSSSTASGTASPASGTRTYTGQTVDTRWGPVQVKITVIGGRITASEAVQYPSSNHKDEEINARALPTLNDEVVQQQSAQIDTVSGATVTSDGYLESLQSAIDQAHL